MSNALGGGPVRKQDPYPSLVFPSDLRLEAAPVVVAATAVPPRRRYPESEPFRSIGALVDEDPRLSFFVKFALMALLPTSISKNRRRLATLLLLEIVAPIGIPPPQPLRDEFFKLFQDESSQLRCIEALRSDVIPALKSRMTAPEVQVLMRTAMKELVEEMTQEVPVVASTAATPPPGRGTAVPTRRLAGGDPAVADEPLVWMADLRIHRPTEEDAGKGLRMERAYLPLRRQSLHHGASRIQRMLTQEGIRFVTIDFWDYTSGGDFEFTEDDDDDDAPTAAKAKPKREAREQGRGGGRKLAEMIENGFKICGKVFRLLVCSNSGAREGKAIFVELDRDACEAYQHRLVANWEAMLPDPSYVSIPQMAKYFCRVGLFASSERFFEPELDPTRCAEIPDVKIYSQYFLPHKQRTLTDGCGYVRQSWMRQVLASRGGGRYSATGTKCLAVQFRYLGSKGVVLMLPDAEFTRLIPRGTPDPSRIMLLLRPSQKKIETDAIRSFGVCRVGTWSPLYVNQEALQLMSDLCRPEKKADFDQYFINLAFRGAWGVIRESSPFAIALMPLEAEDDGNGASGDDDDDDDTLKEVPEAPGDADEDDDDDAASDFFDGGNVKPVANHTAMSLRHFSKFSDAHKYLHPQEPWSHLMRRCYFANRMVNLAFRQQIFVPKACRVLGVADPYKTLRSDQVYVCGKSFPRTSEPLNVIVYRNPCLHPGDIRHVKAMPVVDPRYHVFRDMIIFPSAVGTTRCIPDECSGGDLDGDDFAVIWDPLITKDLRPQDPCDYADLSEFGITDDDDEDKKVTSSATPAQYVARCLSNEHLGCISVLTKAISDIMLQQGQGGSLSDLAKDVAKCQSVAVDYPKTGRRPNIPPRAIQATKWKRPDFLVPKHFKAKRYLSESLLGLLYRWMRGFVMRPIPPSFLRAHRECLPQMERPAVTIKDKAPDDDTDVFDRVNFDVDFLAPDARIVIFWNELHDVASSDAPLRPNFLDGLLFRIRTVRSSFVIDVHRLQQLFRLRSPMEIFAGVSVGARFRAADSLEQSVALLLEKYAKIFKRESEVLQQQGTLPLSLDDDFARYVVAAAWYVVGHECCWWDRCSGAKKPLDMRPKGPMWSPEWCTHVAFAWLVAPQFPFIAVAVDGSDEQAWLKECHDCCHRRMELSMMPVPKNTTTKRTAVKSAWNTFLDKCDVPLEPSTRALSPAGILRAFDDVKMYPKEAIPTLLLMQSRLLTDMNWAESVEHVRRMKDAVGSAERNRNVIFED